MAEAEQQAETKIKGYTLKLTPQEAAVLLATLNGFVAGPLARPGGELWEVRLALEGAAVEPAVLHNANEWREAGKRAAHAILSI